MLKKKKKKKEKEKKKKSFEKWYEKDAKYTWKNVFQNMTKGGKDVKKRGKKNPVEK